MQSIAGSGEIWGKRATDLTDLPAACAGAARALLSHVLLLVRVHVPALWPFGNAGEQQLPKQQLPSLQRILALAACRALGLPLPTQRCQFSRMPSPQPREPASSSL